jgi:hypothetical protein
MESTASFAGKPRLIIQPRIAIGVFDPSQQMLGGSGSNLVLDCTNDRSEYGPASATSDQL